MQIKEMNLQPQSDKKNVGKQNRKPQNLQILMVKNSQKILTKISACKHYE